MSELTFKGTPGKWVARTGVTHDVVTDNDKSFGICDIGNIDQLKDADYPINEAFWNAKLIAAAPELLQELIELNVALDDYWNSYPKSDRLLDIVCKKQKLSLLAINKALNK